MFLMKRSVIFCLFISFGYLSALSQLLVTDARYPDSLLQLSKNTKSDSLKARSLFLLSDYWSDIDTLKSKKFLTEGLKYGDKFPYVKALYYYYLGGYYYSINPLKSREIYLEADKQLSKFDIKEAYLFRARSWGNYANLQQQKDEDLLMLDILLSKTIPLVKKAGNKEYLAKYYTDAGLVFENRWQYDKAEEYFQMAISIYDEVKVSNMNNVFDTYLYSTQNYVHTEKLALAKIALDKTKDLLVKCPSAENYINYYTIESLYYRHIKAYDKSIKSIRAGISVAKRSKNVYLKEGLSFQEYKILVIQKKYKQALDVIRNIVENHTLNWSQNSLMQYYELSETYSKLGNSEMAYAWLKKYTKLRDSINTKDIEHKISTLEVKFKTAEKEKKIIALNAENEKANLSAKNSKLFSWLFGIACLFLLAVATLGWLFYRSSKKLAVQKDLNHQQQIEDIDRRQQIKIVQAMLNAKEEEQNRVARDLHDGLGGTLAGIKINLVHYATGKSNNNDPQLQQIMNQMEGSINELRRIAHDMMPKMLLNFGLEESLRDLCESLASKKLNIDFKYLGIKHTLLPQEQMNIYRIVQEALVNAVKHAEAKKILLQCSQTDNIFYITIEDDGKGFDPAHLAKGMGIHNMKNRVSYLNGQIEILSAENKVGTSINIELVVTT
ncbi:two-component system NarL family sensor kinase [Pedobacter africanus]|uniref:Signal transduction histidine kinase n=2 Tax=Pedobacter africanus TaxID=151894 RepID=A0ACC6KUB6_9SPHI|nr:sensor histidine kinase [Pedobacter africanus]MDR6782777.1 signal transduction histidine kinase [Pedobacter africanus]